MANLYRLFTLCPPLFNIHICSSDVRPTFTGCSHFVIRENSPSWLLSNFVFVQPIVSNLILYLSASEHCSGLQAFQRDRVAGLQSSWANRFKGGGGVVPLRHKILRKHPPFRRKNNPTPCKCPRIPPRKYEFHVCIQSYRYIFFGYLFSTF